MHRLPLLSLVLLFLATCAPAAPGQESAGGTFAVALPALEGPITLGVFAPDGTLVRLLHRDAPMASIPAGLNGLLLTWDGRDDRSVPVPPGIYRARGMVHGPVTAMLLSATAPGNGTRPPAETTAPHEESVQVLAAADPLYEERPLVTLTTKVSGGRATLLANGLPLADLPPGAETGSASLTLAPEPGTIRLSFREADSPVEWTLSGLERIVPLEAGTLTVEAPQETNGPGAFLSPKEQPESAP